MTDDVFPSIGAQQWLAQHIGKNWPWLMAGITDNTIRRERLRAEIIAQGIGSKIAGNNRDGLKESFAELFERFYGQPLHVEQPSQVELLQKLHG